MTPTERQCLEDRLKAASDAQRRVDCLEKVLAALGGDEVKRLNIPLAGDWGVWQYSSEDKPDCKWCVPCGGAKVDGEDGLVREVREALFAILHRRLDEAKAQLEAA